MVLAFSGVHGTAQEAMAAVLVSGRPSVSVGSTAKVNRLPPVVAVILGSLTVPFRRLMVGVGSISVSAKVDRFAGSC